MAKKQNAKLQTGTAQRDRPHTASKKITSGIAGSYDCATKTITVSGIPAGARRVWVFLTSGAAGIPPEFPQNYAGIMRQDVGSSTTSVGISYPSGPSSGAWTLWYWVDYGVMFGTHSDTCPGSTSSSSSSSTHAHHAKPGYTKPSSSASRARK
jgi:hypothetical protein